MGSCQWRNCDNEARRERLGAFKGQFGRDMTLIGTVCDEHKPLLGTADISYWVCGRLAFLEKVEEIDEEV